MGAGDRVGAKGEDVQPQDGDRVEVTRVPCLPVPAQDRCYKTDAGILWQWCARTSAAPLVEIASDSDSCGRCAVESSKHEQDNTRNRGRAHKIFEPNHVKIRFLGKCTLRMHDQPLGHTWTQRLTCSVSAAPCRTSILRRRLTLAIRIFCPHATHTVHRAVST